MSRFDCASDTGVYESQDQYKKHRYFEAVVCTYYDCRCSSPLVAVNHDPFSKRQRLDPVAIEYICDVELATRKALKAPSLFEMWLKLVLAEEIPTKIRNRIIEKCSRLYVARRLAPWLYFRKWKKGRGDQEDDE